jgi:hypothetical protein
MGPNLRVAWLNVSKLEHGCVAVPSLSHDQIGV